MRPITFNGRYGERTHDKKRSNALAERLEQRALELEKFANELTEAQWQTRGPKDARKVGVVVHHVASVYPLEDHAVRHSYHHLALLRALLK